MKIAGSVALVTGASGGIGQAFASGLVVRGASKVYVAARDPKSLAELVAGDGKFVPLTLDVTDPAQIASAVHEAADVTLLVNNAGVAAFAGAIAAPSLDDARQEMDVNYFGSLAMTRAFAPILANAAGGAVINMLSMLALVSLPTAATYSASKAAALSITRSTRAELAAQGTQVLGVLAVQVETAMGAALPKPRLTPEEVVSDALDALQAGISDEIPAGALTRAMYQAFADDPRAVQALLSANLPNAG